MSMVARQLAMPHGPEVALARYGAWLSTMRAVMKNARTSHVRMAEMVAEADVLAESFVRALLNAPRANLAEPIARMLRGLDGNRLNAATVRDVAWNAWRLRYAGTDA